MDYDGLVLELGMPWKSEAARSALFDDMPQSCDALLRGLFQGTPVVRAACAGILDHAPHDERIERALVAATGDPDWRVRTSALHSLSCAPCKPDGCLTTDGVGALIN
ncbi:MAG TPA: hypothetical protein VM030_10835, partial [Acidimicrobiales bacterium]|nr:hypothetical protein [Acidimicrobiales bacterium]